MQFTHCALKQKSPIFSCVISGPNFVTFLFSHWVECLAFEFCQHLCDEHKTFGSYVQLQKLTWYLFLANEKAYNNNNKKLYIILCYFIFYWIDYSRCVIYSKSFFYFYYLQSVPFVLSCWRDQNLVRCRLRRCCCQQPAHRCTHAFCLCSFLRKQCKASKKETGKKYTAEHFYSTPLPGNLIYRFAIL